MEDSKESKDRIFVIEKDLASLLGTKIRIRCIFSKFSLSLKKLAFGSRRHVSSLLWFFPLSIILAGMGTNSIMYFKTSIMHDLKANTIFLVYNPSCVSDFIPGLIVIVNYFVQLLI